MEPNDRRVLSFNKIMEQSDGKPISDLDSRAISLFSVFKSMTDEVNNYKPKIKERYKFIVDKEKTISSDVSSKFYRELMSNLRDDFMKKNGTLDKFIAKYRKSKNDKLFDEIKQKINEIIVENPDYLRNEEFAKKLIECLLEIINIKQNSAGENNGKKYFPA